MKCFFSIQNNNAIQVCKEYATGPNVVLAICVIASAIIIGLGLLNQFGPVGSVGYIASLTGGGFCILVLPTILLRNVLVHKKKKHDIENPRSSKTASSETSSRSKTPPLIEQDYHLTLAFHGCVQRKDFLMIQKMINQGVDVNAKESDFGQTPLHQAIHTMDEKILEMLIHAKADVNAKDNFGQTPLHLAITLDNKGIVKKLIEAKADVNLKNNKGYTPLHAAAFEDNEEIVEILIKAKADMNAKNNADKTPSDLTNRPKIKKLLQAALPKK